MKHIAVEKLAEHSLNYLTGNEALAIEHNGEVVGFYYPKKRPKPEETKRLFEQLDATLERMAHQSGMTKDELIDALDPSKPFPFNYDTSD